jgi:hypothetical protein
MSKVTATYSTLEEARQAVGNSHATIVCTCGEVLENCRCWSADKLTVAVESGCEVCKEAMSA